MCVTNCSLNLFHLVRFYIKFRQVTSLNEPGKPPYSMVILKVHKRENFVGFDFEICTFS
jgi:hypothetical protein